MYVEDQIHWCSNLVELVITSSSIVWVPVQIHFRKETPNRLDKWITAVVRLRHGEGWLGYYSCQPGAIIALVAHDICQEPQVSATNPCD